MKGIRLSLIHIYVRYNNSADLQEYVERGLSRSTDGGQTWEKMRIPMAFGEYDGLPKACLLYTSSFYSLYILNMRAYIRC